MNRDAGFTLVELLITMGIALVILTATLQLILSSRTVYNKDSARVEANQNLRSGMDLMRDDVRQAGERLTSAFPALEVVNTAQGRELITRKNLSSDVLPICYNLTKDQSSNIAFEQGKATVLGVLNVKVPSTNAECPVSSASAPLWDGYRTDAGGTMRVYVWDATNRLGNFMNVTAVQSASAGNNPVVSGGTTLFVNTLAQALVIQGTWPRTYLAINQPRVYLIEEHRYRLQNGLLQMIVNDLTDVATIKNVAANITQLSANTYIKNPSGGDPILSNGDGTFGGTTNWQTITSVRLTLQTNVNMQNSAVSRSLTEDVLPRNVFSK